MSITCVLVRRYYDYYQFNEVLHAGTKKQCLTKAEQFWKNNDEHPACSIDKQHKGVVYTEDTCPGVDNDFLLLLKFTN